jgi:hypothetical protein
VKVIISRLLTLQDLQLKTPSAGNLANEIEALRTEIPDAVLARFDKFLVRGKRGVALVQNSICKGCQIALTVGRVNELITGTGAQICDNCGRYLSLPEADAILFQAGKRADTIVISKPKAPTASASKAGGKVSVRKPRRVKLSAGSSEQTL